MTLILEEAALPAPMWATTRALLFIGKPLLTADAKAMLSPPALFPGEADTRETFDQAVQSLTEYGVLTVNSESLTLTPAASTIRIDDYGAFCDLLRAAVFSDERNQGLGTTREGRGPREFVRALCWFLCREPLNEPISWNEVSAAQSQPGIPALPALPGLTPIRNSNRWNRFVYWALALGFAEIAASGSEGRRIIPDCTRAVGRTIRKGWPVGKQIEGHDVVATVLRELPVLPGGAYSRELGFAQPDRLSPALSLALLSAADRGWIELQQPSDAPRDVFAVDPDVAGGARRITYVVVRERLDG
ncbi:protein DpdG [Actinoplanes sp. NPDC051513]|uniref:protein DpdG n=1 Tax=Actinoplanes sp. NPDC051513 TaxID=3363908 RepID=UPI00379C4BDD